MSILANPLHKSPERAFTLQKYLLLHSQHDALQKNLISLESSTSGSTVSSQTSSTETSPSSSPPSSFNGKAFGSGRNHTRSLSITSHTNPSMGRNQAMLSVPDSSRPGLHKRRSSFPPYAHCENGPETEAMALQNREIEDEEMKLARVNQQIKCTLMELLNCEDVRSDRPYRMWIQKRLMDVEVELRGGRMKSCHTGAAGRRRSSVQIDDTV